MLHHCLPISPTAEAVCSTHATLVKWGRAAKSGIRATLARVVVAPTRLRLNRIYTFALESAFAGSLILFRDNCDPKAISADCSSLGIDGDFAVPLKPTFQSALQQHHHACSGCEAFDRPPSYRF